MTPTLSHLKKLLQSQPSEITCGPVRSDATNLILLKISALRCALIDYELYTSAVCMFNKHMEASEGHVTPWISTRVNDFIIQTDGRLTFPGNAAAIWRRPALW